MNKIILLLALTLLFSCKQKPAAKHTKLYGDWQFLTSNGNYNEAYFSDSTYYSFNLKQGLFPVVNYYLKNDTLYSDANKSKKGMQAIAGFRTLSEDEVILINMFSQDTLYRIEGDSLLSGMLAKDQRKPYLEAFKKRYKQFLLDRGIIDR